jgi:potassium-transporting ATPase KdpC subunit
MFSKIRSLLCIFLFLTLVTGIGYPLVVTMTAQILFPRQANGSMIVSSSGYPTGSTLVGQQFDNPRYFWGRLSATNGHPYNAAGSGGSNLGPSNPALQEQALTRIHALKAADPDNNLPIPVDLVTASASGLDVDISVAAARYQAARIARLRNIPMNDILVLIEQNTTYPTFGFMGETRVNVLQLNFALDGLE